MDSNTVVDSRHACEQADAASTQSLTSKQERISLEMTSPGKWKTITEPIAADIPCFPVGATKYANDVLVALHTNAEVD
jgi:hypothetical protein